MAVILTIAMIQFLKENQGFNWHLILEVPKQLFLGAGVGILFGALGKYTLRRVRLGTVGLYPVLTIALAFLSFGAATLIDGSGFLAVFITAMFLGGASLPYHSNLVWVHDALAWLSQVGMFLMLGLLVFPSRLIGVTWVGLALALFLSLVARPITVFLCLLPCGYSTKEMTYVSWAGLRGAVPIILGTLPVLADVDGADHIFNLVFFIVVFSSFFPGATLRRVTQWLKVGSAAKPAPSAVIELNSSLQLDSLILSFYIDQSVATCDAALSELELPPDAAVVMIVRGQSILAARGSVRIQSGDHVYLLCKQDDRAVVELLFGVPEA